MITLGSTSLDGNPRIAVVVTDQENNVDLMDKGIDVLEIRLDLFQNLDLHYIQENILNRKNTNIPILLTIRNDVEEGARSEDNISDDLKLKIFQNNIKIIDALDIELSSPLLSEVPSLAKQHKKTVIISSHNLQKTPNISVLENILEKASGYADIIKIAAQANSLDDVANLAAFTIQHKEKNLITMSLGSIGTISRLAFAGMGSLLTYSYIGQPSAPGQISLKILQKDLKKYYPKV